MMVVSVAGEARRGTDGAKKTPANRGEGEGGRDKRGAGRAGL